MRRKRLNGYPQAYYTSGHTMPTPFCTSHYMNRFINSKKLVEIKYTNKPPNMKMKQFEDRYKLPDRNSINIIGTVRAMEKRDISTVLKLHNMQQKNYKVHYKMSQDDIIHYMFPKEDVVWTYVIEDSEKNVTDFFSMYRLSQSCTSKEANDLGHYMMHSGCLYYYGISKNSIQDIIKLCLWMSKEDMDCDAFSIMTVMDNDPVML